MEDNNLPLKLFLKLISFTVILIILAIYAYSSFDRFFEKYEINTIISNIKTIRSAADSFYSDTSTLPCTKSGGWGKDPGFIKQITLSNCWPEEEGCAKGCTNIAGWKGPYLDKWPLGHWLQGGGWKYNWNRYDNYGGCSGITGVITLQIFQAVSQRSLEIIDKIMDDGNLSSGNIFLEEGGRYLQILKCYRRT